MTTPTDVSPPAGDPVATTAPATKPRRSRLNLVAAWVGLVAGGLFIIAAIFFAGFFLSSALGGPWGDHAAPGRMACCDHMKPGEPMQPGGQMKPGEMMPGKAMMPGGTMGPAPR